VIALLPKGAIDILAILAVLEITPLGGELQSLPEAPLLLN
jgi:hypothetical protein